MEDFRWVVKERCAMCVTISTRHLAKHRQRQMLHVEVSKKNRAKTPIRNHQEFEALCREGTHRKGRANLSNVETQKYVSLHGSPQLGSCGQAVVVMKEPSYMQIRDISDTTEF